jgi:hypothetical protein
MDLFLPVMIAIGGAAGQLTVAPVQDARFAPSKECAAGSSHFAGKGGILRGEPARPRKLTELPPADALAAVYVRDERGCMVPIRYRDLRR